MHNPPTTPKFCGEYFFIDFHRLRMFTLDNFGFEMIFVSNINYRGLPRELWMDNQVSNIEGYNNQAVIILENTLKRDVVMGSDRGSNMKAIISIYDYFDYEGRRYLAVKSKDFRMIIGSVFRRIYLDSRPSVFSTQLNLLSRAFPYMHTKDFLSIIWEAGDFGNQEWHPPTFYKLAIYTIDRMFRSDDFKNYFRKYCKQNLAIIRDLFCMIDESEMFDRTVHERNKEDYIHYFDFLDVESKNHRIEMNFFHSISFAKGEGLSYYDFNESEVKENLLKEIYHLKISDLRNFRGYSLVDLGNGVYRLTESNR